MITTLVRAYEASAAIEPYRIVAFSETATTSRIAHGVTATALLVGTTGYIGGGIGAMTDVNRSGINPVTLGGTVGAGDALTAGALGKAIKTVTKGDRIIGFAEQPGVANDVIDYLSAPGVLGGV